MARHTGLGSNGSELLRPTVPQFDPADDPAAPPDEPEGEGGGEASTTPAAPARARRPRKAPTTGKTKGRNLQLTDDVYDRLWLLARQRKTNVSAVANEILDRALPRWEVKKLS